MAAMISVEFWRLRGSLRMPSHLRQGQLSPILDRPTIAIATLHNQRKFWFMLSGDWSIS
jgi:hypothetical protein